MQLTKWPPFPPSLCTVTGTVKFERLFMVNKEESPGGKVDDVTLTAKAVDFWVIVNVESA
ncbi:hypothetical protein CRV24_008697 [Beauveria bassiana]|nr:hypothetical protein CRV24_008697 [Beauveria bassiana]